LNRPTENGPSDDELVTRSRAGDGGAFEALVGRYRTRVYLLVHRLVGAEPAEDLTQDVFLRVYQALPRFRGASRFDTWLFKIARNRCYSELKKRGRSPDTISMDEGDGADTGLQLKADIENPGELCASTELRERVRALVDELPVPYRAILTLYHFGDMAYDDIADAMDMPIGTVKSYLSRARRKLRALVIEDGVLLRPARAVSGSAGRNTAE
jgi:RNA polymerase sigma-70 factor (ECF subfamily)